MAKRARGQEEAPRRKSIPPDIRAIVLHEAGYKCANPSCRNVLTLDVHHMEWVSEEGKDVPENLPPPCGHCHDLHHRV